MSNNNNNGATTNTLLLIDVQNDFHPSHGSLAVTGADHDAERIAAFIRRGNIHRIVCTLDTHLKLHIGHACFWYNDNTKKHPDPFTIITAEDIRNGTWVPRNDLVLPPHSLDRHIFAAAADDTAVWNDDGTTINLKQYCIAYATALEAASDNKLQICIWPEHCLIGSPGHAVVDVVRTALSEWSATTGRSVEFVTKGQNILTEMYSAISAEVPVTRATSFNTALCQSLVPSNNNNNSSRLFVCGQALSHCVNYTLRDLVSHCCNDAKQITLLTDCTSPVTGFETVAATFLHDMEVAGVQLQTSTDVVLE